MVEPLIRLTERWRMAKFYGYAKFADGQEFEGNGTDSLIDLATAYNGGENDLVSISPYGPHDTEANWAFTDPRAPKTLLPTMSCFTLEEAQKLLRDTYPDSEPIV